MIDPQFPFVDLHRHLEAAIRLETILDLAPNLPADSVEGLRPYVQVTQPEPGLVAFLAKFEWIVQAFVSPAACQRVAYEAVLDAKTEGLDYLELRFSPLFMAHPHQLNPHAVTEAVMDGLAQGRAETGLSVNAIGIMSRTFGVEACFAELEALLSQRDGLVAVDLAGDEGAWPGHRFTEHFRRVRDAGLAVTVHAGEGAGPESIWQAVDELGATRIGHATRALEDPALVDYLGEKRIVVEANLTSNVQTSTVPSYQAHPMANFLNKGLLATLNTDDPAISAIDLPHEYRVAAPAAGLTPEQIRQAQQNALEGAFLSAEEKTQLILQKVVPSV